MKHAEDSAAPTGEKQSEAATTRILQVVADGYPGGATTHVLQILAGLRNTHSLALATQKDSYLSREAELLGIPVFGLDFFRSRLDPSVPLGLRRIVKEFAPEMVHLHGGRAAFFYALAQSRVASVYTVHGYHFPHKAPVPQRLALSAERLAARSVREVIFVCGHDARLAKERNIVSPSKRTTIVRNGIPIQEAEDLPEPDPRHIGFVGRTEYQKDPILFLDVMECLPDHTATMIGGGALDGEVRAEIVRRGLSNVRVFGQLPHAATLELLSLFGTLVMTSRWEGLPIVTLEALRAGVPVVATNVGGLDEIVVHGESGLLVDSRSPEEIARAVRRLTENETLRVRLVENGRDRIRTIFSEKYMLDRLRQVYRGVTSPEYHPEAG